MSFIEATSTGDHDPSDPKRIGWTPEQLRSLYGIPSWQGGGGSAKRPKPVKRSEIYRDAANWVPLHCHL